MSLGIEVNKGIFDLKVAQAVLALRSAFEEIETITKWLANHPVTTDSNNVQTDPLTLDPFAYSADEAYAVRLYFQTFDTVRTDNASTFDVGRKMTGLE